MTTQDDLLEHARGAIPRHFSRPARPQEEMYAFAEIMETSHGVVEDWTLQTYIEDCEGIWLDAHAEDRALRRQTDETNDQLRERLRRPPDDAVTRPALLTAVQALLEAAGVVVAPSMVEVRRDRGFFGTFTTRSGTGGTIAIRDDGLITFEPDVAFALPVEVDHPRSGAQGQPQLIIAGAAVAANDGTFEVTELDGNAVVFTNALGVADVDLALTWELHQRDVDGNLRDDGRARAYYGRGYRMGGDKPHMIVILPFGTSDALAASVRDLLRSRKAAGVRLTVEVRGVP